MIYSFTHFDPKFRIIRGASCRHMETDDREQKRTRRRHWSKFDMKNEKRVYVDDLQRRNILELLEGNMTEMRVHGMYVHFCG